MGFLLIPIIVLGSLVGLMGLLVLLGRFRGGRYLRPLIVTLSKIGFMRRMFEKASTAALERQNPELASAMRKLQRVGPNLDPQRAQQALQSLSPTERRAYFEALEEQGAMPEPANRQMRRQQQKLQGPARPSGGGGGSGAGGGSKRSKRRR
jgi:hypothetical protein